MQVTNPNNVKIYNLSSGKSLPEWLSDRKRRALQKNDSEIQRRIELIQDFEMPAVSSSVQISKDQHYILTTGVYKPRVRCYDLGQMSMKFERCMDSEVVKFHMLSPDYSKIVFMQSDRYIEFHSQMGRYYRVRIPKFGRDMAYHQPSCDMYFCGTSPEVYRLNLEQGRFLRAIKTDSIEVLCSTFNPDHYLLALGTKEGTVECWDPRTRNRAGILDSVISSLMEHTEVEGIPSITSLRFRDGLTFAAGTSTGQVLLYDLRSDKPLLVKDHNFGLPIKNVLFHEQSGHVLSMDSRILKMWDRETGKAYTSIEPGTVLNDLCLVPDTGMLFMANEAPKILSYYVPSLGPAPKWCSFLDSLTEELEENPTPTVYDDYRFVTRSELDSLGLSHLIGSNLMRAYMHGFFIDMRLYHKAKSLTEPFAYEDHRRTKIREKIEEARQSRVKVKKLPKVNRDLAQKLMEQEEEGTPKTKKPSLPNVLEDSRFADMFLDRAFQVDTESDEYKLLNPLVTKLDKGRAKKAKAAAESALSQDFQEIQEEKEGANSSDEESSDDDQAWTQEVKKQHKLLRQEKRHKRRRGQDSDEDLDDDDDVGQKKPKFLELKAGSEMKGPGGGKKPSKLIKRSLGERVKADRDSGVISQSGSALGNMEMTFSLNKGSKDTKRRQEAEAHHQERRKLRRSAGHITSKVKPSFWMGKRVR